MGSTISNIYDKIKEHGSLENYMETLKPPIRTLKLSTMNLRQIRDHLNNCSDEQLDQDGIILRPGMAPTTIKAIHELKEDYYLDGDCTYPKEAIEDFDPEKNPMINPKGSIFFLIQ